MPDVRVVAKAMNDLADDWHWVTLVEATELEPRVFRALQVRTRCGIVISSEPRVVQLFDMGAPDEPTCPRCIEGGLDPALRAAISEVLESSERVTQPAGRLAAAGDARERAVQARGG
ncbi:MAG: hypothetical protein AB7I38_00790 [Dehalococcoidia bacterium]